MNCHEIDALVLRGPSMDDKITLKDLIGLYLREIDVLQHSIDALEKRLSIDIMRIETDLRQSNVVNNDSFHELRENSNNILDEINILRTAMSTLKDLIHKLEMSSSTADINHCNRIENLEVKVAIYSIITTIASFLGVQGFIQLVEFIHSFIT